MEPFHLPPPGVALADLAHAVIDRAGAAQPPAAVPLERAAESIEDRLEDRLRSGFEQLTPTDRAVLVGVALDLVQELYAHLPLKRSTYAADPVQRLRLLRRRASILDAAEFHRELAATFTALRDAHTRYIGPTSLAGCVAALPFMVEEYGEPGQRRYLVSKVAADMMPADSGFEPGVEMVSWNGMLFARAVEVISDGFCGSHPDARRARGLESLTLRSLQFGPLPDEHWVNIGFQRLDGRMAEIRLDWRVFTPDPDEDSIPRESNPAGLALGVDHEGVAVQGAKAALYASKPRRRSRSTAMGSVETSLPKAILASTFDTPLGALGYLRLWNFAVNDHNAYVDEVRRLLDQLPDRGLIIDIRSNPGGLIWAAERILQLFTPRRVEPTRFSLPVTEWTIALANDDAFGDLEPWRSSLNEALTTGEQYSRPVPLTDPASCNNVGQWYGGPVVCVADARTYSSGDLFAAGFVDNDLGPLITVGAATGGGGANVWDYRLVQTRLPGSRTPKLPAGCGFTFSFRRATRTAGSDGRPIEDVGISGLQIHHMTRDDLLKGNKDLRAAAVDALRAQRYSRLHVTHRKGARQLTVRTGGLQRLRVTVDDAATRSIPVTGARTTVPVPARWQSIDVEGWGAGQLLQRRRLGA